MESWLVSGRTIHSPDFVMDSGTSVVPVLPHISFDSSFGALLIGTFIGLLFVDVSFMMHTVWS